MMVKMMELWLGLLHIADRPQRREFGPHGVLSEC
jgi:hypothetical protein